MNKYTYHIVQSTTTVHLMKYMKQIQ